MKVTVKGWLTEAVNDVRGFRTTVTIVAPTVTTAVTLCGKHSRKQAIGRVWDMLAREGSWSPSFLWELRRLAGKPRA